MKKQKKTLAGLQKRKAISGYIFISPFLVGFAVFMVKPLLQSLYMSFCNVEIAAGVINPVFTKIDQYKYALTIDPQGAPGHLAGVPAQLLRGADPQPGVQGKSSRKSNLLPSRDPVLGRYPWS